MHRRDFIKVVAGSVVSWPIAARTQQSGQIRRIGVLMNKLASDPQGQAPLAAFKQSLEQLGWTDGGNLRIDVCWGADDVDRERQCATDLAALAPNIVFASGTLSVAALKPISRSVPIVRAAGPVPVETLTPALMPDGRA
jgi:putative ABC transport system substrate-binding protein